MPSITKPVEYMTVNVQGTVNMLNFAQKNKVRRFVYAASSSCYGSNPIIPTNEVAAINPEYPYALSKYLGEVCVFHWAKVYGLQANSIRIFNAYGTRAKTSSEYGAVFGVFLKQKLSGEPFTIVGDGEQKRDFIYVSDIARAFIMAAQTSMHNQVWNVGSNNPVSINALADIIGGSRVHLPKRPGEPDITWADTSKIESDLNWKPIINFETGVGEILKNINYWGSAPLWDKKSIEDATKEWFKFMNHE